jgi:hypothetical protein
MQKSGSGYREMRFGNCSEKGLESAATGGDTLERQGSDVR